ncbi:unnamed protein product [Calypogeia fissa]
MGTEERTLELSVISAKELKRVRKFGPDICYAVAYIRAREKKSTPVDKDGGNNPRWNSKLVLTCDESLLHRGAGTITVEIYSHGSFSNKLVGTSKVSLLEISKLINQTRPPSSMSYEVRRPSGKVRGTLTISVKLGEKRAIRSNAQAPYYTTANGVYSPRTTTQGVDSSNAAGSVYPPPKASAGSTSSYDTPPASQVYPPPKPSSNSNYVASVANAGQVYPPPMVSVGSDSHSSNVEVPAMAYPPRISSGVDGPSSKVEEPVMAYPAPGYAAYPYPSNQYGPRYPDGQQYYPSAQANVPYNYQEAYYSKPQRPARRPGGSGMGMGLLGGALGGLLLGDMVGDMGGF